MRSLLVHVKGDYGGDSLCCHHNAWSQWSSSGCQSLLVATHFDRTVNRPDKLHFWMVWTITSLSCWCDKIKTFVLHGHRASLLHTAYNAVLHLLLIPWEGGFLWIHILLYLSLAGYQWTRSMDWSWHAVVGQWCCSSIAYSLGERCWKDAQELALIFGGDIVRTSSYPWPLCFGDLLASIRLRVWSAWSFHHL